MRRDDGWRWLRNSSGIVAALCGLIALPVVAVVGVLGVVMPFGLDGCEFDLNLDTADLGMSVDQAGAIVARVPSCHGGGAMALQLLGPDDAVLWRVEASEVHHVQQFIVGVAPEGFTDAVALAGPLDPATTYDLQMLLVPAGSSATTLAPTTTAPPTTAAPAGDEGSTTTSSTVADTPGDLLGGARTLFRPSDLRPDQVYFGSRTVAPDEFDDAACSDDA